jgi:hypothetical protein
VLLTPGDPVARDRSQRVRIRISALSLLIVGCTGADFSFENKSCSASHACVIGYVCSQDDLCVRPSSPGQPDASPGWLTDGGSENGAIDCDPGYRLCGSTCVRLDADPLHCGGCPTVCPAPANAGAHEVPTCVHSVCGTSCALGYSRCGSACVDVTTDSRNCGACGAACSSPSGGTVRCVAAQCVIACNAALSECGGECVDTTHDSNHCGDCDTQCKGAKGECKNGECAGMGKD